MDDYYNVEISQPVICKECDLEMPYWVGTRIGPICKDCVRKMWDSFNYDDIIHLTEIPEES